MIPTLNHELHQRSATFGESWERSPSGLYVSNTVSPSACYGGKPLCIDLFCGMGGFSLGVMQAGFRVVAACDNGAEAAMTYMHNLATYPVNIHYVEPKDEERLDRAVEAQMKRQKKAGIDVMPLAGHGYLSQHPEHQGVPHFWFGDARKLKGEDLLGALGLKRGDIDLVVGGPPCQGFSTSGKRDVMDPRNSLVFEFARLVLEIWPKSFVMENVPGIRSMKTPEGWPVLDTFIRIVSDGGWASFEALRNMLVGTDGAKAAFRSDGHEAKVEKPGKDKKTEDASQLAFTL